MKKILVFILFAAVLAGFTACESDEAPAWGEGDSFIVSRHRIIGQDTITVYGLGFCTYQNKELIGVTASGPDAASSATYPLAPYFESPYQYYWETEEADFDEVIPSTGTFNFAFYFQTGETYSSSDVLTEDVLLPTVITGIEYDPTGNMFQLAWDALDNADYYIVQMKDTEGNIVFWSPAIKTANYEITAGSTSVYWATGHPGTGEVYKVIVSGYMNESPQTGSFLYTQGKSIATREAVWGETAE